MSTTNAVILSHGTRLCPYCGYSLPLHPTADNIVCSVCRANVCVSVAGPSAADVMAARCAELNRQYEQSFSAAAGSGAAMSGLHDDQHPDAAGGATQRQKKETRATDEAFCEKCGATRTCFTHAKQTRGADEGQTICFECTECHNSWELHS